MVTATPSWGPDILGPDFQSATLDLGPDPDGEGDVVTTLVHYASTSAADGAAAGPADAPSLCSASSRSSRPALVWLHGMTDYFFHTHVAKHFALQGYDFYAVDLRKCGRSHRPGQSWHYASDLSLYNTDLTAALDSIANDKVIVIAHSTGGLIAPLWMDFLRRHDPQRFSRVKGLILNSPWLDMMGVPSWAVRALKPLIYSTAKLAPKAALPGGNLTAYGESLHCDFHGEWDYDLDLKPLAGHQKYIGWLAAVFHGFDAMHSGRINTGVPVLTLQATRSVLATPYCDTVNHVDCIIDVAQTRRWAKELNAHYTLHSIDGARHDVFLSLPHPLKEAFAACDAWLPTIVEAPTSV
ncbi:alpha/beta fold hydrolase [Corynebacterium macginleyi]|uniref:Alpha/beta hydrolase n=1 Tax=Corynebacterium macginleyi TaxID=38290 RepID=A0ABS1Y5H4_9CORY|nr:alpha/beta hydrolase [Corynebacterium macginleyi]MBK4151534.1 alpha/beta fold hydrolase [Corynebacterium macginleyi]MBK4152162.1 alpha/beta fold hydrolase [Corynebacterium macginleyi]MBK4167216.1 alpha/beta fold hydrolase [Corynebacterium macginleyi]MBK4173159.1 alpha/beta fold hydrolase [Corynebacterium macginleyi]MBM0243622.1 alpha/beta hydrolase [Corynebacterium macginleyi]